MDFRSFAEQRGDDVFLTVRAKPRASRTRVLGLREGRLEVSLASPPVEGEANDELLRFLAKETGVARSRVMLLRGEASREKLVRIEGITVATVLAQLRLAPP